MSVIQSGLGPLADQALRDEVTNWLLIEAELLDTMRQREWLDNMVSKEVVYQLPLRETVDRARGSGFIEGAFHLDENWGSLNSRLSQTETGHSWAEDPPSRTRHYVTNVRAGLMKDGEIQVRSNLLLYRTRQDDTVPQVFSGERHDVLVRTGDTFQLKQRVIYLDTTAIVSHNLAIFF
jgi:ethylbenzene dioxygenase beta subunit